METEESTRPPSSSPAAATARYPGWVLLDQYAEGEAAVTADVRTLVTARMSTGHPIGVSLRLMAPPAVSSVHVHCPASVVKEARGTILAAHGDSLLIFISLKTDRYDDSMADYFVYNAGAASADPPRLPSLSLLPPDYLTDKELAKRSSRRSQQEPVWRWLDPQHTGLLRRGDNEDEFAVAALNVAPVSRGDAVKVAKLVLLRHGCRWSVTWPAPVIQCGSSQEDDVDGLLSSWETHTVIPVGDTHLCWVDLYNGLLFCNVFDESPVLRHVPLPPEAEEMEPVSGTGSSRNVCATAGGAVKFVGVFPRCCCGGTGSTHCLRSYHAYTINTWTLRMDDMVWVMDGMVVHGAELWALDGYANLPRVSLTRPIVSVDDPHTILFVACEWYHDREEGERTGWLILVDIRRKELLSVSSVPDGRGLCRDGDVLPTRVSSYLDNSKPTSGNNSSLSREGLMDTFPSHVVVVDEMQKDDVGNSERSSSCKSSDEPPIMQVSAIMAALQEIPSYGLDRDDMLKGYSILSQDDGRRFRSLLGLPKNLRKDWLLMEIKANEEA